MKEPTFSVFVRLRSGQRLTLKRGAPLDVALRFATEVRGERFHNPDDVFILDDASGETVTEAPFTSNDAVVQTVPGSLPTSDVHQSFPGQKDELEQFRHAQMTLRGGQRITTTVERSLGQIIRLMEHLQRSKLLEHDAEEIRGGAGRAIEEVRLLQGLLQQAEGKLSAEWSGRAQPEKDIPPESGTMPPDEEPPDEPA
jgi:hypothetical protein